VADGQDSLPKGLQEALERLPRGLQDHIQRVRRLARQLAEPLGLDAGRVDLAAAAHDLARPMKAEALLAEARRLGLWVHPVEEAVPILLHGPVAAEYLRRQLHVNDQGVLEAVRWHSTGCGGTWASEDDDGRLARVVFLADKLEPAKASRYGTIVNVKELALRDLDAAVLTFLDGELRRLVQEGELLHPAMVEARNGLLLRAKGG
jgi:predicted HD superfamily hydrolase involved in NAD metabolism